MSTKKKITQGKRIRLKKSLVEVDKKTGKAKGPYSQYYDVSDKGKAVRKILEVMAVIPNVQHENKVKILHPVSTSPVWVDGEIFELVDPVRTTPEKEE